jgi:hypothetical protein
MDKGAEPAWPVRFNPDEASAVQHAMNLRLDLGDFAFFAEYQNDPPDEKQGEELLTAAEIAKKVNSQKRATVPLGRDHLTAFIDVQGAALFWMVCAWGQGFDGDVIDYGTFPDQKRDHFTLRDIRKTLKLQFKGQGLEGSIYSGLEALTEHLMGREWMRDDGAAMRLSRCAVDANWGDSTEVVYRFCRQSKHAAADAEPRALRRRVIDAVGLLQAQARRTAGQSLDDPEHQGQAGRPAPADRYELLEVVRPQAARRRDGRPGRAGAVGQAARHAPAPGRPPHGRILRPHELAGANGGRVEGQAGQARQPLV